MKKFIYLDPVNLAPIMVLAKHRPSEKNVSKRGTWLIKEFFTGTAGTSKLEMPCSPEITWPVLKTLKFIGQVPK